MAVDVHGRAGRVLFDLHVTRRGGWAVVAVTGELELATAPRLRQQVVSLVGGGETQVVIDLHGVDFIDSIGLGMVVSALKRCRGRGGDLRVAGAVPRVRAVFEITRLDEIIALYDSLDEAVDEVKVPADG